MADSVTTKVGRRSRNETRLLLLETGCLLVDDEGLPEGFNVRLTEVLDRVDLSTGAAYNIWANQAEFQSELARHYIGRAQYVDPIGTWEKVRAELDCPEGFEPLVRRFSRAFLMALVDRHAFFSSLSVWAIGSPSDELRQAMVDRYRKLVDELAVVIEQILEAADAQQLDEDRRRALATTVLALAEGFALRARFGDGEADDTVVEAFSSGVVTVANCVRGTTHGSIQI